MFLLFLIFGGNKILMKIFYPLKYSNIVESNCLEYGVEKELIYAIIKCESGFDKNARSHAGAIGLMQITEDTFKWLQTTTHEDLGAEQLKDPSINVKYGVMFISILKKKYVHDELVLSAYNAGETTVKRWLKDRSVSPDGKMLDKIPYKETCDYVKKVKSAKKIYKKLYFNN